MKTNYLILMLALILAACAPGNQKNADDVVSLEMHEAWRPQIHFTPDSQWMNDPNGMVYFDGEYHLFYQYHPYSNVWGPMHWGHAISTDLVHWEHLPIALYPDSLGTIFSGSAVADVNNTSGFGEAGKTPLVAIYTNHSHEKEQEGREDYQVQSIAYSLDKGRTWTKYEGNPVLPNPGIRDFRDPKVIWHGSSGKWIMTLAVKDRVSFYSSHNLKEWTLESDFAEDEEHGGVVECPDLFPLTYQGEKKWVLFISLNPGFLHGGSGTKYYVGDFDGQKFIPDNPGAPTKWLDYGKDDYAGVTWSNAPNDDEHRTFIGWMSNWQYATRVPTEKWRSAMTLARSLHLEKNSDDQFILTGQVVEAINGIAEPWQPIEDIPVTASDAGELYFDLDENVAYQLSLEFETPASSKASVKLYNQAGDEVTITLDREAGLVWFDRTQSGKTDFNENFAGKYSAPMEYHDTTLLEIYVDQSSVELFVNGGRVQMTNLVFPSSLLQRVMVSDDDSVVLQSAKARVLNSIW